MQTQQTGILLTVCVCACAIAISGCRSKPTSQAKLISFAPAASSAASSFQDNKPNSQSKIVRQVSHQRIENNIDVELISESGDQSFVSQPSFTTETFTGLVTLAQLETTLLSNHPQILKAQSQLLALTGKKLQASLPPNPNVGVTAEDINADDGAGRYGVYFGRQILRGGKLQLDQSVAQSEIEVARDVVEATKRKLLIELRKRYYDALLAVEKVNQTRELTEILQKSVDTSEKLFEAQEIAKAPLLRSQVELKNAEMMYLQASNQKTAAMRNLAAVLGESEINSDCLAGDVQDIPFIDDFEYAFDQILENHPELSAALKQIEQAKCELARQQAVPIPNLTWQTSVLYDFTTDEMVGGFQVGLPLPIRNRNEGAIQQAQQNIRASVHAADQKVLELRSRLTDAWANYVDARIQLEFLDSEILPKSEESLMLANAGYRQGETPYLELLLAQQLYAKTKLGYLNKLRQRWQYHVEIEGLVSRF